MPNVKLLYSYTVPASQRVTSYISRHNLGSFDLSDPYLYHFCSTQRLLLILITKHSVFLKRLEHLSDRSNHLPRSNIQTRLEVESLSLNSAPQDLSIFDKMPSYYDDDRRDDRRSDKSDRDRDRDRPRRDRPVYEVEETIEARRGPARGGELVRRRRDSSESSVEEVERKFPPAGDYRRRKDYGAPRRAKSHGGGGRYDDDYDDKPRKKDRRRKSPSVFGCNNTD